jgi:DNA-binding FrmR family transcriptional regulator
MEALKTTTPALSGPVESEVAALLLRLHRIEGQVHGLAGMIEAGRACADVVTQISAVSRALDRVGFMLVAGELRKCASSTDGQNACGQERLAAVEELFLRLS